MVYTFDWDPKKAIANQRKHGVSFVQAATVFNDPRALTVFDGQHSNDEDRWITLGISGGVGLVVVHHTCEQIDDSTVRIRIISGRNATKREIAQYAG